jgi:hypothetical protein
MLDEDQVGGTITDNPAAPEATGSVDQASPVTNDAAPQDSGDIAKTALATASTPPTSDESSLTSQTGPQNTEQGKSQAQIDWERRYHEQAKGVGSLRREVGELRKYREQTQQQYEGIDPQAVKAWKAQQQQAEQKALPKWHQRNPEAPRFKQQYQEYTRLASLYQRAKTDEAKAEIGAELEQFPADVRQQFNDFNTHRRTINERIAEEMTGYNSLEEMIAEKAQAVVREQQERMNAEQNVNKWFDDQANQPLVEHTREAMAEALREGVPLPYVQAMAQMRYKLDIMESRLAGTDQVTAAAQARTQAAKANAAITRDTAPGARRADPVAIAKERGIDLASSAYVSLLSELSAKKLI